MNDIGLDPARPQPARQPEAVATGLISDGDARDRASRLGGFVLPAAKQAKQLHLIGVDLFQRVASDPGHDRGHEPARLAHLNDGYEGAALIEGETGSAQVIVLRHEKLQSWFDQRWCFTLAGLHSFSPQRNGVWVVPIACRTTAGLRATATRAVLNPLLLASRKPQAFSREKRVVRVSSVVAASFRCLRVSALPCFEIRPV